MIILFQMVFIFANLIAISATYFVLWRKLVLRERFHCLICVKLLYVVTQPPRTNRTKAYDTHNYYSVSSGKLRNYRICWRFRRRFHYPPCKIESAAYQGIHATAFKRSNIMKKLVFDLPRDIHRKWFFDWIQRSQMLKKHFVPKSLAFSGSHRSHKLGEIRKIYVYKIYFQLVPMFWLATETCS